MYLTQKVRPSNSRLADFQLTLKLDRESRFWVSSTLSQALRARTFYEASTVSRQGNSTGVKPTKSTCPN